MKTMPRKIINLVFSNRLLLRFEDLLIRAYSSPNPLIRRWVLPVVFWLYRLVLFFRGGLSFDIYRLEGIPENQNKPITMIYFQSGRGIGYLANEVFGDNGYRSEQVGSCRWWKLAKQAQAAAARADLVVIERNTLLQWIPRQGQWLRTPTWVSMAMEIDPHRPWEEVKNQMHSQHSNIRMMKKWNFTYKVSHDPCDFDFFYERMYVPYIGKRYPETGFTDSKSHLRKIFERGFLAQIGLPDGEPIAAVVSMRQGELQFSVALGVLDANTDWLNTGVLSALYYFQIKHAYDDGLRRIDAGGVRPFLKDGLFQYKYRWGLRPVLDYWNPREWLIWNPNGSDAARQWAAEHPIVPDFLRTGCYTTQKSFAGKPSHSN